MPWNYILFLLLCQIICQNVEGSQKTNVSRLFMSAESANTFHKRIGPVLGLGERSRPEFQGLSKDEVKKHLREECCNEDGYCKTEEIAEFREQVPMTLDTLNDIQCQIGLRENNGQCRCNGDTVNQCGLLLYKSNNQQPSCKNPCKKDTQFYCSSRGGKEYQPDNSCVASSKHCDSHINCPNVEDEKGCTIMTTMMTAATVKSTAELKQMPIAVDGRWKNVFQEFKSVGMAHINKRPICKQTSNGQPVTKKTATKFCQTLQNSGLSANTQGISFQLQNQKLEKEGNPLEKYFNVDVTITADTGRKLMANSDPKYSAYDKRIYAKNSQIDTLTTFKFERIDNTKVYIRSASGKYIKTVGSGRNLKLLASETRDDNCVFRVSKDGDKFSFLATNGHYITRVKLTTYMTTRIFTVRTYLISLSKTREGVFSSFTVTSLGNTIMADVDCKGSEQHIGACSHKTYREDCNHGLESMLGVACLDPVVLKLAGGETIYEGQPVYDKLPVMFDQSEEGKAAGKAICSTIFEKEFLRGGNKGVPFFGWGEKINKPAGMCVKAVCKSGAETNIHDCNLEMQVTCQQSAENTKGKKTVDYPHIECAKCNLKKLLSIVESVKSVGITTSVLNSLKAAKTTLEADCRHWDDCLSQNAEDQKYREFCIVKEFIENSLFSIEPAVNKKLGQHETIVINELINNAKRVELSNLKVQLNENKRLIISRGKLSVTLGEYLEQLAQFDNKLAEADAGYAFSKWKESKKSALKLATNMDPILDRIINAAIKTANTNTEKERAKLTFSLLNAFNPMTLKDFDFSGFQDLADRAGDLNVQIHQGFVLSFLPAQLVDLKMHVDTLNDHIKKNKEVFEKVNYFVTTVQLGAEIVDFKSSLAFMEAYNAYTPAVTKNGMAKYVRMVEEIIEKCCQTIEDSNPTDASTKEVQKQSCPTVKLHLASMEAFYEDLEEQQFDIMDSFARMARSRIAKYNAEKLKKLHLKAEDQLEEAIVKKNIDVVMRAQRIMYVEAQCNYITYMRHGKEVNACKKMRERPRMNTDILSQNLRPMCKVANLDSVSKKVKIPISSTKNEAGYLNLTALYESKNNNKNSVEYGTTTFTIPNRQWLVKNGWIFSTDKGPFFIEKLNIHLPPNSREEYQYQLKINFHGNKLNGKMYSVEGGQEISNQYTENAKECSATSVSSLYSVPECNGNLAKVCRNSDGKVTNRLKPVLIGSTWEISLVSDGHLKPLELKENSYVYARIRFCSQLGSRRTEKRDVEKRAADRTCCSPSQVYDTVTKKCTDCPSGYLPFLWDRYCEKCPPGYGKSTGSFGCQECPLNTYKSRYGAERCAPCLKGYEANVKASTECVLKTDPTQKPTIFPKKQPTQPTQG